MKQNDPNAKETILEIAAFLIQNGATALEVSNFDITVKCNLAPKRSVTLHSPEEEPQDDKDDPAALWKAFSESTYYAGSDE
jgi:hypothetical protein